ncbi:MAG: MFS transporter, partial [Planctomycetes bacterium]|nr:MFS transporter [Planctomycetota bacterium]
MMGVMTANSSERTVLASYRFIGAFAANFFVSGTMLYLVGVFGQGDDKLGFTLTVTLYAFMACGFFLFTYMATKERIKPPKSQNTSVVNDFKALLSNGPWLVMIVVSVLTIMWIAIRGGATIHYFKYAAGNEHWGSLFLVVSNVVPLVGVLFTQKVSALLGGKKKAYVIINFASAFLIASFYFIDPKSIYLVMIHQFISSFVAAPLMPLFWSMIADTADYGAWKLGQRSTGLLFSAGTFSQKIGWSIGPAISLWLLSYFGFKANEEQSAETLHGLQLIMSLIPAAFALLTAGAVLFYKIDLKMEKQLEEVSSELSEGAAQ